MDGNSLKKWAEELQRKERLLQEKEKELETKLKTTTISDPPPTASKPHRVGQLNHSNSASNLVATLKESDKAPGPPQAEPKKIISGRFKNTASRKPYRLQPLSEKNSNASSTTITSSTSIGHSLTPSIAPIPPTSPNTNNDNSHNTNNVPHHTKPTNTNPEKSISTSPSVPSHSHLPSSISPAHHHHHLAPVQGAHSPPQPGSKSLNSNTFSKMSAKNRSMKSLALKESVSDKQVADALSAFNTVDKDHNGVIDSFELYDALKVLYGEDISKPEANKFYLSIDSNRSGFITFDEFLHATIQYHWDISLLQTNKISKNPVLSMEHEWEIPYEELVFETKLGEGTYGVVYKGKWRHTTVAIKELKVSEMKEKLLQDFRNEISIMGRLRHPNVILYMGACTKEPHFCIVTELLPGGSIYDVLHTRRARFDLKLALYFAKQTALALNYLHMSSPQIVHRDLKTENLLLDNHLNVKVCDFGLSCVKPPREVLKEQVGSPLWMAPEVLAGGTYDERCDVYSFALVLWEFFANQLPYAECEEFHQLVDAVVNQKKRPPMPPHIPPEIAALIKQCWDGDPAKRPSFATIVETVHEIDKQRRT